jgi:hypothetical protein
MSLSPEIPFLVTQILNTLCPSQNRLTADTDACNVLKSRFS